MHTILIVEDNLIFLKLLTSILHEFKDEFKFVCATNGQYAIEILNEKPISLLVTDIEMPKVDGLELLAHVKKHYPAMPCIVMTAYELDKTLLDNAVYLFTKPFYPHKLGQVIVQVLKRDIPLGSLSGISVVSFLEMIKMARKTCLCEILLPNKERGFFYFYTGILYDVISGDLKREEAAMKFLTAERANFIFKYLPKEKIKKRGKMDFPSLIREAKRRQMGLTPKKITDRH